MVRIELLHNNCEKSREYKSLKDSSSGDSECLYYFFPPGRCRDILLDQ